MERRILGLETEYGSVIETASGQWRQTGTQVLPAIIRREAEATGQMDGNAPVHRLVQLNGSIIMVDRDHLELATPECLLARDLVRVSKAGDRLVEINFSIVPDINSAAAGGEAGDRIRFIKDNVCGGLNTESVVSFGSHENYSVENRLVSANFHGGNFNMPDWGNFITFLFTRSWISGGGGISRNKARQGYFIISPRMEYLIMLSGSFSHYIYQFKESYVIRGDRCRLQIGCGDANIAEYAEYLKFGITSLVLRLMEDGIVQKELKLQMQGMGATDFSARLSNFVYVNDPAEPCIKLANHRMVSPLDIQEQFLALAKANYPRDSDSPPIAAETLDILERWEKVLIQLRNNDIKGLARILDWPMVQAIQTAYLHKEGLDWPDLPDLFSRDPNRARETRMILEHLEQRYRWLGPQSLWRELCQHNAVDRLLSDTEVEKSINFAPGWDVRGCRARSWIRSYLVRVARRKRYCFFPHSNPNLGLEGWGQMTIRKLSSGGPSISFVFDDPFSFDLKIVAQRLRDFIRS